ncbi:aminoacyl-tRNA deacylase [Sulfolobus acidocaldarius]|uniref:Conserved protein n=4 Tax=Sulfolobus acidocaldarius TaxID=2285 RepID=Q4J9N0_SULAC|nr:YbaK/EbsC family protein [Sulfolobus acidocaldarius]AAY80498.1 conserved protein [Sulfolobus acidocaldarius DSM 639]AGE71085.1 hypothetical protein SacN8_05600 [Sulfolobus acidocaldarius N8]AGE73356.1 hypothetical protein SacRon12I_05590 [Sulfolobus acidocaldarius Ron12/I]ALU28636.1 hypothetical protein ATY89_00740 [Sulfolobus acidocaldarius]ALU31351.1 hypothetical protein ATZ20_03780 [Sulfolobus acidocaldarius]
MNDLEDILKKLALSYKFISVPNARTVKDASMSLGVSEDRIAKTILVIADNKPYAVFLRGNRRVDLDKLKLYLNVREIRVAKASEVKKITGYEVGGLPPLINGVETIMDEELADDDKEVFCGGGNETTLLSIIPKELAEKSMLRIFSVGI